MRIVCVCVCVLFWATSQAIFPWYNLLLMDTICRLSKLYTSSTIHLNVNVDTVNLTTVNYNISSPPVENSVWTA